MIRIIDDSGDDYLYLEDYFEVVDLNVEERLDLPNSA
jgi:hypothetical protein